jgi:pyridoxine/pyridoxamine 5'-phosphate oxidase
MDHELQAAAKDILNSISYMTLGTADQSGQPWVSPVYFSSADYSEFYWISSPEAKHSKNIVLRPQISIVIFDSRIPIGMGQAVYISAVAGQVNDAELMRSLAIYNGRFPNPSDHGARTVLLDQVRGSGPYRLYRAVSHETWMLDRESHPDRRILIKLSK